MQQHLEAEAVGLLLHLQGSRRRLLHPVQLLLPLHPVQGLLLQQQ
jgi:hypothetical protein